MTFYKLHDDNLNIYWQKKAAKPANFLCKTSFNDFRFILRCFNLDQIFTNAEASCCCAKKKIVGCTMKGKSRYVVLLPGNYCAENLSLGRDCEVAQLLYSGKLPNKNLFECSPSSLHPPTSQSCFIGCWFAKNECSECAPRDHFSSQPLSEVVESRIECLTEEKKICQNASCITNHGILN